MSDAVPDTVPDPGVTSELFARRRLILILLLLLAEIVIFFAGLYTPLSTSARQVLANQTSSQFGAVESGSTVQLVAFIFAHNLSIALFEMVPVAGALLFAFSVYSTGIAAQALVASQGLPTQWGAVIFAFPYSLVELSAYAVAVVAGAMLFVSWRKKRLMWELKVFVLEGATVAVILLVAAAMEAATVRVSYLLGFALWLPTGLALAGIVLLVRRMHR